MHFFFFAELIKLNPHKRILITTTHERIQEFSVFLWMFHQSNVSLTLGYCFELGLTHLRFTCMANPSRSLR